MSIIVVTCVVVSTGLVVKREISGSKPRSALAARKWERIAGWDSIASRGTIMGESNAPITVTEFSDFQCPYCRRLAKDLTLLRAKYAPQVRVSYRHYPIESRHPHARVAAAAAECSRSEGMFESMHDLLFAIGDSIGLVPWGNLAERAGMKDSARFLACMRDPAIAARIDVDIADGKRLSMRGTPLVMLNEWRTDGAPPFAVLDSVVRLLLERRTKNVGGHK